MHHRMKIDAPSGTAARLTEIILEERKLDRGALRHGREGITGERKRSEVGIHSLRGGDVVGDHTVVFAGMGERLELTHRAGDRAVFAQGALRAAQWVVSRKPGVYDMQDVLGLT
jgi:4-hydroxy-tetrahydrodipicolinate reductase